MWSISFEGVVGSMSLRDFFMIKDVRANAEVLTVLMGLEWTRTSKKADVLRIWQAAERDGLTGGVPLGDRKSFLNADIVAEALDAEGNECFIVAEASYTVRRRDVCRVIGNASYLMRFTGKPCYMAVAGVSRLEEVNDVISEVDPQVFDGAQEARVFWVEWGMEDDFTN